jgi:integrase
MTTDIVLSGQAGAIAVAGQVANHYAAGNSFSDYTARKADNTLRAQHGDLETWSEYLCAATNGADCPDAETLQTTPDAWRGVTWGLVKGFIQWMLSEGYAIGTINRHLATVRVYCKLAAQAGVIAPTEAAMIRTVQSYGGKDAKRIDERRETTRRPTKRKSGGASTKKAAHVTISLDQAKMLKAQPDTPQGRRDALLMTLLLDHGLRVGELVLLKVTDFDLKRGTFAFYRPKVDKTQTHKLTTDAARAVAAWIASGDAPAIGQLLRGSRKGGKLAGGISERAVSDRVRVLGEAVGLEGLSAHDCRHYWATRAASQGTDPFALRDAGGWSSLAMPSRYVEAAAIANERVKL